MIPPNPAIDCWYLTGATAVGKTAVAMELAQRIGAELLSLDSMAVYRGMDIGTAKPSIELRRAIPHHLIDIVDADQDFSVAQYRDLALAAIAEIRTRGRTPLFVGGTLLYLKCLLRGFFDGPPADWEMRNQIEAELATAGPTALHERLTQIDPVAAAQIHANDTRRLIRALEVYHSTGQPISHQQMEFEEGLPAEECRVFVLRRDREEQNRRIEARVEAMMVEGLVDEVRGLTADGKQLGRTAQQAVGYSEVLEHLAGEYDLPECIDRIKARTRRFAKRQGTWFRGLGECRFIDLDDEQSTDSVVEQIVAMGQELEN
jgi:tRNA dimethylallyltransferase